MLSRATCNSIEFGCFDANIILWDKGGEYGLEGSISLMAQHEELKNSYHELNIIKCSNFSRFYF